MIRVNFKTPVNIRKDKLKVLFCPDWQNKNMDGSARVNGGGCDGIFEFVNTIWVPQADINKQALWKKDDEFGGKWHLKFDGLDDEYLHQTFEPISIKDNAQIFAVYQFPANYQCLFSTPQSFLFCQGASVRSNGLYSGPYGSNWTLKSVSTFVRRADPRFKPDWSYQATNSINKINHLGWGDANTDYGFVIGSNIGGRYFREGFAFLAIWEDSDPLSESEIEHLMRFGRYYFDCYKNYDL